MKKLCVILLTFLALPLFAHKSPVGYKMKPDTTLQHRAVTPDASHIYAPGDTVIVPRKTTHYLTGEPVSDWVYNVTHIIQKVGCERFPQGILLAGINSWVESTPQAPLLLPHPEQGETAVNSRQYSGLKDDSGTTPAQSVAGEEKPAVTEEKTPVIEEKPAVTEEEKPAVIEEKTPVIEEKPAVTEENPVVAEEKKTEAEDVPQPEQTKLPPMHRLSIGIRGGAASLMQQNVSARIGYDALLDMQYACYWRKHTEATMFGLIVGLAAGYQHNDIFSPLNYQENVTADGLALQYTIKADNVYEHLSQIQVELPILFSFVTPVGFYMNIGPKFILPVHSRFSQTMTNPSVDAYAPELDVHFINDAVLGAFTPEQTAGQSGNTAFRFVPTVAGMIDLGYEAKINPGNALGIGVFADYGFSFFSATAGGPAAPLTLTPPASDANAQIAMHTMCTQITRIGFFDAGLKLTWHFNLNQK